MTLCQMAMQSMIGLVLKSMMMESVGIIGLQQMNRCPGEVIAVSIDSKANLNEIEGESQ